MAVVAAAAAAAAAVAAAVVAAAAVVVAVATASGQFHSHCCRCEHCCCRCCLAHEQAVCNQAAHSAQVNSTSVCQPVGTSAEAKVAAI